MPRAPRGDATLRASGALTFGFTHRDDPVRVPAVQQNDHTPTSTPRRRRRVGEQSRGTARSAGYLLAGCARSSAHLESGRSRRFRGFICRSPRVATRRGGAPRCGSLDRLLRAERRRRREPGLHLRSPDWNGAVRLHVAHRRLSASTSGPAGSRLTSARCHRRARLIARDDPHIVGGPLLRSLADSRERSASSVRQAR